MDQELMEKLWSRTLVPDRVAFWNLISLCETGMGVDGDFVECGTFRGGSASVLGKHAASSGKRLWLYDSFKGLPQPTQEDGPKAKGMKGKCHATRDQLEDTLKMAGVTAHIIPGWFENTFSSEPLPDTVALLHIDADWYNSVFLCLATFWDRIPRGGVMILDDYGYWSGAQGAWEHFCSARGLDAEVKRCGESQAWVVKK